MPKRKLTKEEKIQKVIDDISNCHPDIIDQIMSLKPAFVDLCTGVELSRYVRNELLGINAPLNRSTKEYWLKRGWSEKEAIIRSKENGKKFRKNFVSPFSKKHWIEKGYSEEEAEYIRNSKRPIRKEYWIEKGYSENEAIQKAKQQKDSNNKKGASKSAERSVEYHRKSSPRCVEFYIERDYSEAEAKEKVNDFQNNFTIEKCVERHGMKEGVRVWEDRQKKWQKTLKNKSENEINEINHKKNAIGLKNFTSIEECIDTLKEKRGMDIFSNITSFMAFFQQEIKKNPYMIYWKLDKIMSIIPKVQKEIIDSSILEREIKTLLKSKEKYLIKKTGKQAYRKWEDEGLLRSSYEIYFYETFKERFPEKKIKIDNCYPNSNFRYDFLINDNIFVEIAPEYENDENYRNKMNMKEKVFGCIILKTIHDIDIFLENLE